ncbi:MAG: serine--tRNA ligase [Candidatus Pacebacteria bacterium]|nr:serine--tRNA ligase [Candidatus Paceibacterota bacterium]
MLDIKFIRENRDLVKAAAQKKHIKIDVDRLLQLDIERLDLLRNIEALRTEQNKQSAAIQDMNGVEREQAIITVRTLKESLKEKEPQYKKIHSKWQSLMYQVPNIPDMTVPDGISDADNVQIREWGTKTNFSFEPRDHVDIMTDLGMVDFERGTKVHGFRGYYLKGDAVRLSFAIWQYALNFFSEKGFNPMLAPAIVREENLYGTGHLPNEADDVYKTQDNDYLAGTAEVPVMGYHSGEILAESSFPIKYLAFTPSYRREAGSHGKDTRGLIRVHEFYKWEQLMLCEASHQKSVEYHDWLNRNTEEFIESMNIPYQTVLNCGGDLGQGQVKKYDIELWVPMEKKYREISSASYFHDFQTRRFNIRYKNSDGEMRFAHSLNCTAIPTPRILVSLIENFQQSDGTIKVPEVLRPYLNGKEFLGKQGE